MSDMDTAVGRNGAGGQRHVVPTGVRPGDYSRVHSHVPSHVHAYVHACAHAYVRKSRARGAGREQCTLLRRLCGALACVLIGFAVPGGAQSAAVAPEKTALQPQSRIGFSFEREGLQVPRYSLDFDDSGKGTYRAEVAPIPDSPTSGKDSIERPVQLSAANTALLFQTARELNFFRNKCNFKGHNLANQGNKKLTYIGPEGTGECAYNYSSNERIQKVTDMLMAVAFTLDEGRKLQLLHTYDRLGLDAEMEILAGEVKEGRASELANIGDVLRSIMNDRELIERVRTRAYKLLALRV